MATIRSIDPTTSVKLTSFLQLPFGVGQPDASRGIRHMNGRTR